MIIPCKDCVILAACTSKDTIRCELLSSFVFYADFLANDKGIRDEMHNQVNSIFHRSVTATMPDANLIGLETPEYERGLNEG